MCDYLIICFSNYFGNHFRRHGSWRIKIALESYFEEHAQEVWGEKFEENYVVDDVQTNVDGDGSEGTSRATQRK